MKLRIAFGQINAFVGNFQHNFLKIKDCILKAKERSCDLVVFPELAITGYPPEDLLHKEGFIRENMSYVKKIVSLCDNIICLVGFVRSETSRGMRGKEKDQLYNSAALIHKKRIIDIYNKIHLPNYGVFDEKRYFAPGHIIPVYDLGGIFFGISICEDIWAEDTPLFEQSKNGSIINININASPYYKEKAKDRLKRMKEIALKTGTVICYLNMVGGQDEVVYDGHSLIVDNKGQLVRTGKQFEEDLFFFDLEAKGKKLNRKSKVHLVKIKGFQPKEKKDFKKYSAQKTPFYELPQEIYTALTLGTRDYVDKNNFKKVVIGLSGGIDSALTTLIAVDALGKKNVTALFMPSRFTSQESRQDAETLARNLGIKLHTLPIDDICSSYLRSLEQIFRDLPPDITEENIQARIRGNILMAFSNKFKALVLATGNKSEMSTGYTTLYGDLAGGFAVIKDVPKTLVYQLVHYRNKQSKTELVPARIIHKAPTAELKKDQKDSDTLPPYPLLDKILFLYIEKYLTLPEIMKKGFQRDMVKKVIGMVDRSEYKRRQSPPGIKISKVALGKDRRMPITNGFAPG
ncbi:MAG: NAD+ synthase [Spirochaetes bacterium]|nr:NAD+ synthase [Spirochaetota bacterium]